MLSGVYFHCKTIRNAANITAKSVILGRKNLKKVSRNPGGTDFFLKDEANSNSALKAGLKKDYSVII